MNDFFGAAMVKRIPAIFLASALLSGVAYAQMPTPGAPGIGPAMQPHAEQQAAPPPALPGAAGADQISPNNVAIDNQNPTKVLFSAINHGDYAEARAAVSRGADLHAKNALDETPIQLSVELGRNDITFMLLSVLHENQGVSEGNPITLADRSAGTGHSIAPAKSDQAAASRTTPHFTITAASPRNPTGLAAPSKGFLGFGKGS